MLNFLIVPPLTLLIISTFLIGAEEIIPQKIFDLTSPVIFQELIGQEGRQGHFGWSTTLVNVKPKSNDKTSWIFIGDPKANVTRDPTYKPGLASGVVWRCSLNSLFYQEVGKLTPACETLNIDPILTTDCSNNCPRGSPRFEYHVQNWVGGTIVSSTSRLVVSAHRWHRGPDKEPVINGLSYWFDTDKMYSSRNELDIGNPIRFTHRLIPFYFEQVGADPLPFQYVYDQEKDQLLPDFAYGQAGFSLHLTQDASGSAELLMGAPGVRIWRGGVILYRDSWSDIFSIPRLNANRNAEFDRYRIARRNYRGGNEYFGYAVSSGRFIRHQRETFYAGSSPRGNDLKGEVVIFQFLDNRQSDATQEYIVIQGDQFGSYFGAVLTSVDLNKDGWDELLIGAPYFNEPITNLANEFVDHGTVFLYTPTLTASGILSSKNLVRITSGIENKRGGRFGAAIANLGDINEDGFQDIAIGAPFEDGIGAVYIFHGKEDLQVEWKPNLRVTSSAFTSKSGLTVQLKGFGCAFSTSLDVDNNYTPDLAIGAYISESVMILRSRPILDFQTNITYYAAGENSRLPIRQLGANVKNFQIQTCIRLKGKALARAKTQLSLEVTFAMDVRQPEPRFSFIGEEGLVFINKKVIFQLEANAIDFNCRTLQTKVDIVLNEKSPSIDPIYFEQVINYKGKSNEANSVLIYGIQSTSEHVRTVYGKDTFEPMAPFPLQHRLTPEELNINSDCRDVTHCVPDLHINAWWADDSDLAISRKITTTTLDWSRRRLGIHVKLSNTGEPAYSLELTFVVKSHKFPRIDFQSPELTGCRQIGSDKAARKDVLSSFTCSLGKPVRANEPNELVIPFDLFGLYATMKSDELIMGISVAVRNDPSSKRVHEDLILTLVADVNVKLIGSVTPVKEAVNIHSKFLQQYEVILTGVSPVDMLFFNFKFPVGKSANPVLALNQPTGNGIQCTKPGGFADFSKEEPQQTTPPLSENSTVEGNVITSRRRREIPNYKTRLPEIEKLKPNENMTLLGCDDGEATSDTDCVDVSCVIYDVRPNFQLDLIVFNMKLNASQLVGILGEKRVILLESIGKVEILKKGTGSGTGHTSNSFSQTIVQFNEMSIAETISLWTYILSGIGGFLLLLLLMFFLYKYGFFRRATKEQLEERKAEVEVQEAHRRASILENPNRDQEHEF